MRFSLLFGMVALCSPPARAEQWTCADSPSLSVGACEADRNGCERFRAALIERVPDLGECRTSTTAFCFGAGPERHCAPRPDACEALRRAASSEESCQERDSEPVATAPPVAAASFPTRTESYAGTMLIASVPCVLPLVDLACVISSPLVHAAKGNGRGALISFGLHLALPIVGGMIGDSTAPTTCNTGGDMGCAFDPTLKGVWLGIIAASLVDLGLSKRTVVLPAPMRGGAVVTFAGRF
jgi:hypothetical protein